MLQHRSYEQFVRDESYIGIFHSKIETHATLLNPHDSNRYIFNNSQIHQARMVIYHTRGRFQLHRGFLHVTSENGFGHGGVLPKD